jgi:hypothetical protein
MKWCGHTTIRRVDVWHRLCVQEGLALLAFLELGRIPSILAMAVRVNDVDIPLG